MEVKNRHDLCLQNLIKPGTLENYECTYNRNIKNSLSKGLN